MNFKFTYCPQVWSSRSPPGVKHFRGHIFRSTNKRTTFWPEITWNQFQMKNAKKKKIVKSKSYFGGAAPSTSSSSSTSSPEVSTKKIMWNHVFWGKKLREINENSWNYLLELHQIQQVPHYYHQYVDVFSLICE